MRLPSIVFIAAILLTTSAAAATKTANTCTDPYWKDTLRCAFFPELPPQPNLDAAPELQPGVDVPKFTRVFLENADVRCTDGTMPLLFVDKAICTDMNGCGGGTRFGEPIESNRWIFTMHGGGACTGDECRVAYSDPGERTNMGSAPTPVMANFEGIYDPDPILNPLFAAYNRVRVDKCTFDRYTGRWQDEAPGGFHAGLSPNGRPIRYNLYFHGYLIMEEALEALEKGLHYTTWRLHRGGEKLIKAQEKLPPLAEAETVLFVGHSNAAHGLYHNIDHLAATLSRVPGFRGDVRAFFDENFQPSVQNEAAFATTAPPGSDLYSAIWTGASFARGEPFSYDGKVYHETDRFALQNEAWRVVFDASCTDAHAADGTTWMCRDRMHVLFNHITTPFLVRQDFRDPNADHLDLPNGYAARWGTPRQFTYCPTSEPCWPRFNPAEFRARVEKQVQTLFDSSSTRSELARGTDPSGGSPTMYAWMPNCGQHDGAYSNNFFAVTIATSAASFTLPQWLDNFLTAPRAGVHRGQIDGFTDPGGRLMLTTRCTQAGLQ